MSIRLFFVTSIFSFLMLGCSYGEKSNRVGWDYDDPKNGGFQGVFEYEQECPPGMVLLDAGEWCSEENDTLFSYDIRPFFISKYEETNGQYLQYLNFLAIYYPGEAYEQALPDTSAWLRDSTLDINERTNLMKFYLRHPIYVNYPVVGLSESQIERYAIWKTDRINEYILIREQQISPIRETEKAHRVFTTSEYYANQYHPRSKEEGEQQLLDLDPKQGWSGKRKDLGTRIIRFEDAILCPVLRLPTEGEQKWAMMLANNAEEKSIHTPKEMRIKKKYISITPIPQMESKVEPTEDFYFGKEEALITVYTKSKSDLYLMNTNVNEVFKATTDTTHIEKQVHAEFCNRGENLRHLDASNLSTTSPIQLRGFRLVMDHISPELTKRELRK